MNRSVRIGDTRIAFDERGVGRPLLLVHGFPFDRSMWARLMRTVTRCRRVAPDLRGFGASTLGRAPPTMARYADDLVGLLDVLDIRRAVVCGLSMGGYVAFEMVRRHPRRVSGLVLMDTRPDADSSSARASRNEMARLVAREGMRPVAVRLVPKLLAEGHTRGPHRAVRHVRRMIMGAPPRGVIAALRAMRDRSDARKWLSRIEVPTLVITGAEDQLVSPEVGEALAGQIRGARSVTVPRAGHLPPLERPHITGELLRTFLRGIARVDDAS